MIINTMGLLEICYIFVFSRNKGDFKFFKNIINKKAKKDTEDKAEEDVIEVSDVQNDDENNQ